MPQSPPRAGARRSRPNRLARPDAARTRSASSGAPSTRTPVARPRSVHTSSTCPTCRSTPGSRSAAARRTRSKVSRRHRMPITCSGPPAPFGPAGAVIGCAPAASRSHHTSGSSARSASTTCARKACGWWNCITPRRDHEPSGCGPGSRSTTVTPWPRRASAIAVNSPVGPAPTTTIRIAHPSDVSRGRECRAVGGDTPPNGLSRGADPDRQPVIPAAAGVVVVVVVVSVAVVVSVVVSAVVVVAVVCGAPVVRS